MTTSLGARTKAQESLGRMFFPESSVNGKIYRSQARVRNHHSSCGVCGCCMVQAVDMIVLLSRIVLPFCGLEVVPTAQQNYDTEKR